jgi:hypothetical protein
VVGVQVRLELRHMHDQVALIYDLLRSPPTDTGEDRVVFGRIPSIAGPVLPGSLIGSVGLATIAKWFALLWLLYIIAVLLGPETQACG